MHIIRKFYRFALNLFSEQSGEDDGANLRIFGEFRRKIGATGRSLPRLPRLPGQKGKVSNPQKKKFIKELKKGGYSYEKKGDEILVTHQGDVNLGSLESLPSGVQFQNQGDVWLDSLESLSPGVQFENQGDVLLDSLESLSPGVQFENQGGVWLNSLQSLPSGVQFQNQGGVWLHSLVGGWIEDWKGNIEGVNPKRLLNLMISKGVFL